MTLQVEGNQAQLGSSNPDITPVVLKRLWADEDSYFLRKSVTVGTADLLYLLLVWIEPNR